MDGHVHLHEGVRPADLLDHAVANLGEAAGRDASAAPVAGVLCLVRPDDGPPFGRLHDAARGGGAGSWALERADGDPRTLTARRPDGASLALVAGRQLVTGEGLEVLALGTRRVLPRGRTAAHTLEAVAGAGAVPVIPWGFGKWWFRRGRLLRSLLRRHEPGSFFLGDNAGRLPVGPHLSTLRLGRSLGYHVLPGSDPLPLAGHERRAGRYGFLLPAPRSGPPDAAWLVESLRGAGGQPATFGGPDPVLAALASQLRLRLPG